MTWMFVKTGTLPLKNPLLIEGLPGIGNVGKVTADFLIDQLEAKKLCEFHGHSVPHSVFVNEKNLVELPKIEMYGVHTKHRDLLILAGDVQPLTEESCFEFCELVLKVCKDLGCKEIIALGGIGLKQVPKSPKIYCTGTEKPAVQAFTKATGVSNRLYGVVGPIIGVSGVIIGLAGREKMQNLALLAETFGHPMYLGIKGAKELLRVISHYLKIKLDLNELDDDIAELEEEMLARGPDILPKFKKQKGETSYIG